MKSNRTKAGNGKEIHGVAGDEGLKEEDGKDWNKW